MYQDFGGERDLLAALIESIGQFRSDCLHKYDPEFAVTLQAFLSKLGVTSQLVAIGRTTFGAEQNELSSSPIAHVVLRCFGTDWDAGGADAEKRFINEWFDFAQERTVFHRSTETVDSLDELCLVSCTPMEPTAMATISESLAQAWTELAYPTQPREEEAVVDVPL